MSDDLVKRLRAVDHLDIEDCFMQSPLYEYAADRIEALTEQLEAARADAKEAETYADELEKSVKARTAERNHANDVTDAAIEEVNRLEAKLAGVLNKWADAVEERDEALNQLDSARHSVDVLEKRVAFVEKERRKTLQALLKVTKIHDEVEAKLAKAVEALKEALYFLNPTESDMEKKAGIYRIVTTLAEIESSEAVTLEGEKK